MNHFRRIVAALGITAAASFGSSTASAHEGDPIIPAPTTETTVVTEVAPAAESDGSMTGVIVGGVGVAIGTSVAAWALLRKRS